MQEMDQKVPFNSGRPNEQAPNQLLKQWKEEKAWIFFFFYWGHFFVFDIVKAIGCSELVGCVGLNVEARVERIFT